MKAGPGGSTPRAGSAEYRASSSGSGASASSPRAGAYGPRPCAPARPAPGARTFPAPGPAWSDPGCPGGRKRQFQNLLQELSNLTVCPPALHRGCFRGPGARSRLGSCPHLAPLPVPISTRMAQSLSPAHGPRPALPAPTCRGHRCPGPARIRPTGTGSRLLDSGRWPAARDHRPEPWPFWCPGCRGARPGRSGGHASCRRGPRVARRPYVVRGARARASSWRRDPGCPWPSCDARMGFSALLFSTHDGQRLLEEAGAAGCCWESTSSSCAAA